MAFARTFYWAFLSLFGIEKKRVPDQSVASCVLCMKDLYEGDLVLALHNGDSVVECPSCAGKSNASLSCDGKAKLFAPYSCSSTH